MLVGPSLAALLRDEILDAFDTLDDLRPGDIGVLVPDMTTYAPLIDAVFGAEKVSGVRIPYHVADPPFSPEARALMPNPVVPPSEAVATKFRALMESMGSHGSMPGMPSIDGMLASQNLRDATMAETMVTAMRQVEAPLAIHVNGSFHSEAGLGTPEHVRRLAPKARILIVTMRPKTDDLSDVGTDDFLVLTAPEAE